MQIILFIEQYWKYISVALIVIIDLIVIFARKKTYQFKMPSDWRSVLITLIQDAETFFGSGHGDEKLSYVIKRFCEVEAISDLSPIIKNILIGEVESILSTPQKKGGSYGETKDEK